MSAYTEALALQKSMPKTGAVPWEIAKVYNALLAVAKDENPGSISLGVLEPLKQNSIGKGSNVSAESLGTMVAIVAAALKSPAD